MKHDLDLYFLHGELIPGFYAAASAKRCARGREDDSLMLLIAQTSGTPITPETLQSWFNRVTSIFYKTSGSVTAAMRAVVNALNSNLIEVNLKLTKEAEPHSAVLSLAVIHHDTLFVAQSGLSQVLLLQDGSSRLFFDPDLDPRGMGLTQIPQLRFFQESLGERAIILFSAEFPAAWQEGALASLSTDVRALQERVLAEENLPAPLGMVEAKPGAGVLRRLELTSHPDETQVESQQAEATPQDLPEYVESASEEIQPEPLTMHEPEVESDQPEEAAEAPEPIQPDEEPETTTEIPMAVPVGHSVEEQPGMPPGLTYSEQIPESPPRKRKETKAARKAREQAAYTKLAEGAAKMNQTGEGLNKLFSGKKAQTEGVEPKPESLSSGTKLLLAVVIPLLVVAIASIIYITQGKENQYQYLMAQAQAAAENAALMSDSTQQREGWNQVMNWLDQAEDYRQTNELRALRVQAQNALDRLDGAVRLHYTAAYAASQLPSLQISRLVSIGNELYLLDQASGAVLHMSPSGSIYNLDLDFKCAPGVVDGVQVGKLVEVMSVPINNAAKAPLFALDAEGNGLFCQPKKDPVAISLLPPDSGWGKLQSAFYDSGRLFVLDPAKNALWIYRGTSMNYTEPPDSYFEDMTIDLSNAVAATGSGDELFLLFEDGHTMHCLASNVTGLVNCDDPYPYVDGRTSAASQLNFGSLRFSQLAYSPPPDPSLYYLEADKAELYQFSLRLNLNRILRADVESGSLPRKVVTAFNVSTNRLVFLAFGNELYYASLP
jgi:hypothetical protein